MDANTIVQFLKDFFIDRQFFTLLSSTIILFFAVFIMWYFYHEQLTKKDLFMRPQSKPDSKLKGEFQKFTYFLKYLVVFPIYSFIWFVIFAFLLMLMAKARPVEEILFFGIVVVSVTRISAYVSPSLAEDMGKLLPWALIVLFLTDPQSITLESLWASTSSFVQELPKVAKYLIFITFVEWSLRIGSGALEWAKRRRKSSPEKDEA